MFRAFNLSRSRINGFDSFLFFNMLEERVEMNLVHLLETIDSWMWGAPLLILVMGTGLWLTIRLKMLQIIRLPLALKLIGKAPDEGSGDVSSFGALSTALAATVGTGSIVGVATAIKLGGPGSLFWMLVAAFFGMATKYAEGLLSVKYRVKDRNGQFSGGPMYYIENGLGRRFKPLAMLFAFSGILVALFGIGTFPQVKAIVSSTESSFGVPTVVTAIIISVLTAVVTIGGLKSIAKVSTKIVPFMSGLYIVVCLIVLIKFAGELPHAIALVLQGAFSTTSATGGFAGATIMLAMRSGVARGIFANEAGLGSAPIAAAAAKTKWPAEQGLISMTGVFIDTMIICNLTGFTLLVTGIWSGNDDGGLMTQHAFSSAFPAGAELVTISLILFAFTTILGWNYYGERCVEYLLGVKWIKPYRYLFIILVAGGAFIKLDAIWLLADIFNAMMAFPNLIALLGLSGIVVAETRTYMNSLYPNKKKGILAGANVGAAIQVEEKGQTINS
ncbi:sodium:alanine symporter family protein [Paenibacillus sp. AK121]|nr:sodium:alanine symporter family protein [Paenibacillus sp. lzh-N1]MBU9707790.1 sodium:alanine symporter family protein [Paenibacillus sp. AK121]QOH64664.1 sodium:alanine symporter family protein [Paenibacillus polymyxa]